MHAHLVEAMHELLPQVRGAAVTHRWGGPLGVRRDWSPTVGLDPSGLAWAGALLGVPVVICVTHGNNPEKNAAMRGFGAVPLEFAEDRTR